MNRKKCQKGRGEIKQLVMIMQRLRDRRNEAKKRPAIFRCKSASTNAELCMVDNLAI